jgi:antitoxin (DNA-binding transcriptional repressor) of toxin-antitoxin stability system
MKVTATKLRQNLYRILDRVAETGETVEIVRGDKVLRIAVASPRKKMKRLVSRKDYLKGDPDEIVHMDWTDQWKP